LPKPKKFKLPSSMAIPAILIGKLARDKTVRGKGLGGLLLFDALQRCVEVNARSAAYAVVLDAINDEAKAFYLQYEFQVMTGKDPYRLFLAMQHVVATLTQPGAE
jgi:predicted GNAT family N-acyltransferase